MTSQARSTRKAKGQGGERREEILAHAERLFLAHGVHSVSTRQLALAVGISQPSLYAYFPKRADLLAEVSRRAFAKLIETKQNRMQGEDDSVEEMLRSYVAFGLEEPDAYRIAFMLEGIFEHEADLTPDAQQKEIGMDAFAHLRQTLANQIGGAHPHLEITAQSLWSAIHGLVSLLLARSSFPWVDREALIDWHIAALLKGLPEPNPGRQD